MYCINCGHQNKDDAVFCANCGTKLPSAAADNLPTQEHIEPVPPQAPSAPAPTAQPQGYQVSPPGGAYAGVAPSAPSVPKKKSTGLIIGLSVGGVVLFAAIVVALILLSGGTPVTGIWVNDHNNEVLEFDDDGDVTIYTPKVDIDGTYEYDERSGEGVIETKDKDYDFVVAGEHLVIDKERGFIKDDDDFDIDDFIEDAEPKPTEEPKPETTDTPVSVSTAAPAPTAPAAPAPSKLPDSKKFTIPSAAADVLAPSGWYVHEDMYDESFVMCLTNDDQTYADFILSDEGLSDTLSTVQEYYQAEDIIGGVEEITIGGMKAYRFQYALMGDSIIKGYEYVIELPSGVLEIDMYYEWIGVADGAGDTSSPEMVVLRAIAESVRVD